MAIAELLRRHRLLAIVRLRERHDLKEILWALERGGVKLAEITLDTLGALEAIEELAQGSLMLGVGTVTEPESIAAISEAGASFIVTPGFVPEVVSEAKRAGLGVICGALTPSEIIQARHLGADVIKLFPAVTMGPDYLKQILAPLWGTPIIAVGGIEPANARDYLAAGAIGVAAGSSLVSEKLARGQDWPEIERRSREFFKALEANP